MSKGASALQTGPSPCGSSRQGVSPVPASVPCALEDAIILAAYAHRGQVDKAGQPYILHPIRVMLKLEAEDKRIAAMLHDTVEDCEVELGEIRTNFGPAIADAVDALTRREGESYMDFIERCGANDIARAVKWADLCDNMKLERLGREPTNEDAKRQMKYQKARDRLNAIAMETRRAETVEQGSVAKP
jgi:guanosine-3',5'-bis(diphosphate) 3'-pyrophosphohydrolase